MQRALHLLGVVIIAWLVSPAFAADAVFENLGIGGGGGMFTPAISPDDPNLFLLSCDMGGAYRSEDGGKSWSMLHWREMSDALNCRPVFTKDGIYWAADVTLKVSKDKGKTWTSVLKGPAPWTKRVAAIAHGNAGLFVGTEEGLFASLGNKPFAKIQNGKVTDLLALDSRIWAVIDDAVWAWDDGALHKLPLPGGSAVRSLAGGTDKGKFLLLAAGKGGVLRSMDDGKSWQLVADKIGCDQIRMAFNQLDVAYAGQTGGRGLFKSTDGGKTWASCFDMTKGGNVAPSWVQTDLRWDYAIMNHGLGVSPVDPAVAIVSTQGDLYITRDGAKSWQQIMNRPAAAATAPETRKQRFASIGLEVTSAWQYLFDPHDKDRAYIAYTDLGFVRSLDRGKTWVSSNDGCPWSNTFYQVVFDPQIKGKLYAACSNRHDIPHWTHISPNTPGHKGGVCVSDDHGATWKVLGKGLPELPCTSLVVDPKSKSPKLTFYTTLYEGGVYKSVDNGATWEKKSTGLGPPDNQHTFMVRIHPAAGDLFCSVTATRLKQTDFPVRGGLWTSRDGGDSWTEMTKELDLRWPTGFAVDPRDEKVIYLAAGSAPRFAQGGLYRTADGGKTWKHMLNDAQLAKTGSPGYSHCMFVTINPTNADFVYLSTGTHGLWMSKDAGGTWARVDAFPFRAVSGIDFDPADPSIVYVNTFGGSVWRGPADPLGSTAK